MILISETKDGGCMVYLNKSERIVLQYLNKVPGSIYRELIKSSECPGIYHSNSAQFNYIKDFANLITIPEEPES